jgi:hypothetical protein
MNTAYSMLFAIPLLTMYGGCTKDDGGTSAEPVPSRYFGTLASATESGTVSIEISVAKASGIGVVAMGTMTFVAPAPDTVSLTGTFTNDSLRVSGAGYRLSGVAAEGRLPGTYTGPNGFGGFSLQYTTDSLVTSFCGSYTSLSSGGENGRFNLVVGGFLVGGVSISETGQDFRQLNGTLNGNIINIPGLATGVIGPDSAYGTFTFGLNQGRWSAFRCR